MNDGSLKTLFYPFESGMLDGPGEDARVLFLNAAPGFALPENFPQAVALQQELRPFFRRLEGGAHVVQPQPFGEEYDTVLVLTGRHRGQNELWVAEALKRVRLGGIVVVAGGKTDGIASLRKRLSALHVIDDHASKNHGVAFWLTRTEESVACIDALEAANPPLILDGGFLTVPGVFSQEHEDQGSRLLADNMPDTIKGRVADFGTGWGYLAVRLSQIAKEPFTIDMFDASFQACVAAKANMDNLAAHIECRVQWIDLLAEKLERVYDNIIMNPPFHQGRAAEPSIGEGMIRAASAALKPGGRLYLVANRSLPYEKTLEASFSRHGEICRDERFKVLWAAR
ncbi:class I SAM-dependent methyltransferase [Aquamicrobium zhengzhouense]|uniref:Class I SAM-dependent methyltransferase n=1 Tax=Aquamicrobium zhengzhouense TaxID=2781738 RepID=A0ABS0SCB1_9HYPH|nr:class I SAM-dependent methyltransferase [Aquamicrobium zhengzhouense]MBI1620940.1 class I SAM-dependent methyltransferase [Aquamicrobium zhengzhouense]